MPDGAAVAPADVDAFGASETLGATEEDEVVALEKVKEGIEGAAAAAADPPPPPPKLNLILPSSLSSTGGKSSSRALNDEAAFDAAW